jgi:hypothetical protein
MTIKALFPTALPTLNLDFANTKVLDPRITFSRASTGTFVSSNGLIQTAASGAPRFDHNPTTGESLGLLVEEARTNLVLRSEEFDNASWTKTRSSVTANAIVAPDSATTADKLVEDTTASATHQVHQSTTKAASALPYAGTIYVKAAERSQVFVGLSDFGGNESYAIFNLSTKTVGTPTNAGTFTGGFAVITELSNGWFRCSISATSSTSTTLALLVRIANSSGSVIYTGDGTSGIYVWGAQVEAGSFPTSYIPTTTATATRAADVASITGTAFSSFYNQTEGSFFCSTFAPKGIVIFGTGDTFDNTQYVTVAASNNVSIRSGGSAQAVLTAPVSSSANTNIALSYVLNSFAAVSNGGTISTDTSGAVPLAQVRLKLGSSAWDTSGLNNLNGTIRRLTYWPIRLPNTTLQAITTS